VSLNYSAKRVAPGHIAGYIRAREMLASQENFRGVLHRVNAIDANRGNTAGS